MKRLTAIFASIIILLLPATPAFASAGKPAPSPIPANPIVCVDAGHGGSDMGATNGSLTEAQETLIIAQDLQGLLPTAGYSVVMTRTSDITLTNSQRAAICNTANANVLVSIHLNGSTDPSIDYTRGLYGKPLKDKTLTSIVHSALYPSLGIADGGITNFADGMLLKANMPATLQETVFITSSYEYPLLLNGTRQLQIAQALLNGINTYFGH